MSGLVEYLIIIIIMASSKYEFVNCDNFTPVELIITTVTVLTPHQDGTGVSFLHERRRGSSRSPTHRPDFEQDDDGVTDNHAYRYGDIASVTDDHDYRYGDIATWSPRSSPWQGSPNTSTLTN